MVEHVHRVQLDTGVTGVTNDAAKGVYQEHVTRITDTVQPASLAIGVIVVINSAVLIVYQDHAIKAMGHAYRVQQDIGVTNVTSFVIKRVSHVVNLMGHVHLAILDIGVTNVNVNVT